MAGSGHPFLRARSARIDIEVGMGIFDPFPLSNPVRRSQTQRQAPPNMVNLRPYAMDERTQSRDVFAKMS